MFWHTEHPHHSSTVEDSHCHFPGHHPSNQSKFICRWSMKHLKFAHRRDSSVDSEISLVRPMVKIPAKANRRTNSWSLTRELCIFFTLCLLSYLDETFLYTRKTQPFSPLHTIYSYSTVLQLLQDTESFVPRGLRAPSSSQETKTRDCWAEDPKNTSAEVWGLFKNPDPHVSKHCNNILMMRGKKHET